MNHHIPSRPADGSIPHGVTVREYGDPKPESPRNMLERAAMCDNRDFAASLIATILHIKSDRLMKLCLSEPARWAKLPKFARLEEIASWIRAECFEVGDLVRVPKISTIGD